jgi:methionyl-tRNA synthetase
MQERSPCIFSTGTDEHGLKVQEAAVSKNVSPKSFCDDVSLLFRKLFDDCNVSYTDYIRTTENRHVEAVEYFWVRI